MSLRQNGWQCELCRAPHAPGYDVVCHQLRYPELLPRRHRRRFIDLLLGVEAPHYKWDFSTCQVSRIWGWGIWEFFSRSLVLAVVVIIRFCSCFRRQPSGMPVRACVLHVGTEPICYTWVRLSCLTFCVWCNEYNIRTMKMYLWVSLGVIAAVNMISMIVLYVKTGFEMDSCVSPFSPTMGVISVGFVCWFIALFHCSVPMLLRLFVKGIYLITAFLRAHHPGYCPNSSGGNFVGNPDLVRTPRPQVVPPSFVRR